MPNFIRPAINAVTSVEELTVGTKLWHAYGIWAPFVSAHEYTVVRAPIPYNQHPSCPSFLKDSESIVFNTINGEGYTEMHFASDGNIGNHHNDNYWFKTKESAEVYRTQCREDWDAHPEEIERVQERRRQDVLDELDDDCYDYDHCED
jgi:hypothetical protein